MEEPEDNAEEMIVPRVEADPVLETRIYAKEKEGLVDGIPFRKLSKKALDKLIFDNPSTGFIEGSRRTRKTGSITIRNGKSFPTVVEEDIGSRTSAFEVHRWWAKTDEEGKQMPMEKVLPEEIVESEVKDTIFDHVLFDPKPRAGRGYTIIGNGPIPGNDPVYGAYRPSRTGESAPRLPNVGMSLDEVICVCEHTFLRHTEVESSEICWAKDCSCFRFQRKGVTS